VRIASDARPELVAALVLALAPLLLPGHAGAQAADAGEVVQEPREGEAPGGGDASDADGDPPEVGEDAPEDADAGRSAREDEAGEDEAGEDEAGEDEAAEEGEGSGEDEEELFPEGGDLSDLVESEDDLAIPDVVARAAPEPAARPETGGSVQRLDEELLERFNYDDAGTIVAQAPGAYVRQEDGYGLRPNIGLRGVNADRSSRVTLLADGVLFAPAPYAAPAGYFFPLMTRMRGVDVYTGSATIPYGPRSVGGAIDLLSREIPRQLSGGFDLALGSTLYGRSHGYVGASNEWGGFLVEGVYLHSDGFKHYAPTEGPRAHTGFDRGEIVLRGELHGALSSDVYHRLELRLGFSGEVSNETYLGLSDPDFQADPYLRYQATALDRMGWWRTEVQVRHRLEWGDRLQIQTIAYRHDLDRSWLKLNAMGGLPVDGGSQARLDLYDVLRNPVGGNAVLLAILQGREDTTGTANDYVLIGANARRFGVTGLQSDLVARAETGPVHHQLRGGLRVHHDYVDRLHTEDAYAMISGELVRATESTYTTLRNHAEVLALSAYFAWGLRWETLTFTPGVRAELMWSSFSEEGAGQSGDFRAAVLPGGSIEWAILPELSVYAGVMRGFAPVAPGQAAAVQPEDSVTYEAGARLEHAETGVSAQLTGFVNDYSNFLQQCSFSAGCAEEASEAQANGGSALVGGVDVRAGADVRIDEVTLPIRATYTFTYTELRSAIEGSPNPQFVGGQPGDQLPYIPEHQFSIQAGAEMRVFGINVSGSYVSEMWESVGSAADTSPPPRTDAAFLLDASAYVEVHPGVRLYLRGENLTNAQTISARRPFGARPNRPLLVQGGLRVDL
jgi:Fe(3+) dicitrate transport protein